MNYSINDGDYSLNASLCQCGRDISLTVIGGTRPHVGAVALALPRTSLADDEKVSATVSSICVTGHKDDELARRGALALAGRFNCTVVVSLGIHIDNAGSSDIQRLCSNFDKLIDKLRGEIYVNKT
jgi:hypothetical protein